MKSHYSCLLNTIDENSVKLFLRSFWKWVFSKRNEFAPILGANSFLLEKTPFQKGLGVKEMKLEVTTLVFLKELTETLPSVCR